MIVWEISIGTIVTLITLLFVASGFYWKTTFDAKEIKSDVKDIKEDIKILNQLVIGSAVLTKDVSYLKDRIDLFERRFDKVLEYLRRGGHDLGQT